MESIYIYWLFTYEKGGYWMKEYKRYGKDEFLTVKDVIEALKKRVRLIWILHQKN